MVKKTLAALAVLAAFTNFSANEDMDIADKCESNYSSCLEICDSSENTDKEACYDKCDEAYSKCLEQTQSN